jgi:hypothetical protein
MNQCVGKRGERYHVRDVNERGWITMVALLRVFKNGADGYGLGANMVANPANIRYPAHRSEEAKYAPCRSRSRCHAPNAWRSGACQYADASGFEGIGPYPGQRIHSASRAAMQAQRRRGDTMETTRRDQRRDPDTARDVRNGHGTLRYAPVDATTLQRRPGPVVRLPL